MNYETPGSLNPESEDIEINLPFLVVPLENDEGVSSIKPQDLENIGQEIFQAWYKHQELSRTDAVGVLRTAHPTTNLESVRNLLVDSYLFAQRAIAHKTPGMNEALRLQLSTQDAQFQQEAAKFLHSINNLNIKESFWVDFRANQDSVERTTSERTGSEKGIRALVGAIKQLQSEGWKVYFPEPIIDARDKIDLIAKRGQEVEFVQVKSGSEQVDGKSRKSAILHQQNKINQFNEAILRISQETGVSFHGRVLTPAKEFMENDIN